MSVKIRPLGDRVLALRVEEKNKTKGGIFIPDSAAETPCQAKVMAVGPGKSLENGDVRALAVKAGDLVVIGKYAGTEVKIDGEEYLIVREDDIMGVIVK